MQTTRKFTACAMSIGALVNPPNSFKEGNGLHGCVEKKPVLKGQVGPGKEVYLRKHFHACLKSSHLKFGLQIRIVRSAQEIPLGRWSPLSSARERTFPCRSVCTAVFFAPPIEKKGGKSPVTASHCVSRLFPSASSRAAREIPRHWGGLLCLRACSMWACTVLTFCHVRFGIS